MTTTPAPTDLDTPPLDAGYDVLDALEKSATPAPWAHEHDGGHIVHGPEGTVAEADYAPDAKLIAAARNALPALLDELAEARRELDAANLYGYEMAGKAVDLCRDMGVVQVERDTAREELAKTRAELDGRRVAMTKVRDYIARHWADESAFDCEAGACNCLRFARDVLFVECGVRNDKGYSCTEFPNHVGDHVAMGQKTPDDEPFETARWPQDANPATTAEPAANLPCHCPDGRRVPYCLVHGEKATAEPADEPKATEVTPR